MRQSRPEGRGKSGSLKKTCSDSRRADLLALLGNRSQPEGTRKSGSLEKSAAVLYEPDFLAASRKEPFKKLKPLEIDECPFANLPEKKPGRWGGGLTAAKMLECRWLKPMLVGNSSSWNGRMCTSSDIRSSWHCSTTKRPQTFVGSRSEV
jgi:hypothetical protein